jgi:hypothetical protein
MLAAWKPSGGIPLGKSAFLHVLPFTEGETRAATGPPLFLGLLGVDIDRALVGISKTASMIIFSRRGNSCLNIGYLLVQDNMSCTTKKVTLLTPAKGSLLCLGCNLSPNASPMMSQELPFIVEKADLAQNLLSV